LMTYAPPNHSPKARIQAKRKRTVSVIGSVLSS
jgi:hypothetical protein